MQIHLATVVRNEAGRYWESALDVWDSFADTFIVLDDHSEDTTVEIAKQYEKTIIVQPFDDERRMWGNEARYRKALWSFAATNAEPGDVIFWEDADMAPIRDPTEFFEQDSADAWAFPLFDFWSMHEMDRIGQRGRERYLYRDEEPFWTAHRHPRIWAVRVPEADPADFEWGEVGGIHTGHFPQSYVDELDPNVMQVPRDCGIGHWGYFHEEDRKEKFERYMDVADELSDFQLQHAKTIVDEAPRVSPLHETVEFALERASK